MNSRTLTKINYHYAHLLNLFKEIGNDAEDPNFIRFVNHIRMSHSSFEKYRVKIMEDELKGSEIFSK